MKSISKVLAVVLSAFVILSCAVPAASAGQTAPSPQIEVIRCDGKTCPNISELLNRLCKTYGICLPDSLIADRGCRTSPSDTPPLPTETTVPATKPTEPAAKPTEPAAKPTEPARQESAGFNAAYEAQVLQLVNSERAKYHLAPLVSDEGAVKVAHLRAKEIVQRFSHTRPDGSSCFSAADKYGVTYRTAGENIAYGYATPEQVVDGWMHSEGHRKNILSSSFTKLGIGCYRSGGVLYWSQFFIG